MSRNKNNDDLDFLDEEEEFDEDAEVIEFEYDEDEDEFEDDWAEDDDPFVRENAQPESNRRVRNFVLEDDDDDFAEIEEAPVERHTGRAPGRGRAPEEDRHSSRPSKRQDMEERPRKKKKKKNGLVKFLVFLILILSVILALCVWELYRTQNGEPSLLSNLPEVKIGSLLGGQPQTSAPTQAPETVPQTILTTEAPTTEAPTTQEPTTVALTTEAVGEPLETQTWQEDENGAMIIPARTTGSKQTEPRWTSSFTLTGDTVLDTANRQAAMYDYDTAIATIQAVSGYENNQSYVDAVASYESQKAQVSSYGKNNTITHIFFHTLAVDTSRCFDETIAVSKQDGSVKVNAYNEVMTTVDEFCRIIQSMYDQGYVLVSIYDVAGWVTNEDGTTTMQYKPIYLPAGKIPFVLSVDDVSYYEYMSGHGFATKLVVNENGKVVNEYVEADGTVSYGAYDVLPILEDFIEAHPDFSYRGAKGIIALTGYEGILGYRTSDFWYNWNCDYFLEAHAEQRQKMYYNNENIEQDKIKAKEVAEAIKAIGWTFASHSWGHRDMGTISYENFAWDTEMWEKEVEPLIGDTDVIIFPKGADIDSWRGYAADNPKYQLLKSVGFDYFCNVDSNQYWIQIGTNKDYFRMGRRNLDGQRLWEAVCSYAYPGAGYVDRLSDLVDSRTIFDWSRPTPVE